MTAFTRFHDAVLNNNAAAARRLLDEGLNPNGNLEACTCQKSCDGYTLLYMACVHNRMTIVQILLEAGADPDRRNSYDSVITVNTPFVFVIRERNQDLLRVLLRESKVRADLQFSEDYLSSFWVPYGLFCEFHESECVIKVLMDGESLTYYGNIANLLHGAAKDRSLEVCKVLLDYCGVERLVDAILRRDTGTETISYLLDVYGARKFVENEPLRKRLMMCGFTGMLELLMGHFYQLYGDNKEWWTEQMVTSWVHKFSPGMSDKNYMHLVANFSPLSHRERSSDFDCLLRWGVYSILPNTKSLLGALVKLGRIESASVLISIYPQCLQEEWLRMERKPCTGVVRPRAERVEEYVATLVENRRHAPPLQILCRSVIFHNLGINPILKAERLSLPRILKDFVQCKELFETDD